MTKVIDINPEWCKEMRGNMPETIAQLRDGVIRQAEELGIIMSVVWYDEVENRTQIVATSDCYDYNNALMVGMLHQAASAVDGGTLDVMFVSDAEEGET